MGGAKYIGYLVPIVLILVLIEWLISRFKGKDVYRFQDTMVNMCCGMLERMFDLFFVVLLYFLFEITHSKFAVAEIPTNAFTWILGLLVADFLAYWHHRLSHEINFLWAAHIVHHQSEQLNLTTVFRVSAFAVVNRAFFFIWLPIIGFTPALSTSVIIFIGLFQFITHTRLMGKLGVLEYIFVTPSSHRVHHGRNDKYIDKNYGHVFIFWDRMFKTYKEEEEEPDYGITTGFESSNAYWAYLSYWVSLFSRSGKMKSWKDKVLVFIKPPAWLPEDQSSHAVEQKLDHSGKPKTAPQAIPLPLKIYVFINVFITIATFISLLINKNSYPGYLIILIAAGIGFSILTIGLLMDLRDLGWYLEIIRLSTLVICIPLILFVQFEGTSLFLFSAILVNLIFALWLFSIRHYFKPSKVYQKINQNGKEIG